MVDYFSGMLEYMDLVAKQLAICIIQSSWNIVYIYNTHAEANHSHSEVLNGTVSRSKSDLPCGTIDINGMVIVYNEQSILMVLDT